MQSSEISICYVFYVQLTHIQRIFPKKMIMQFYGQFTMEKVINFSQTLFKRLYLGQFLSDFEKLGTVMIGEARSLS